MEGWHGQTIDHPVAEMREYVQIVRAILRGEDPPPGRKWRTGFRLAGLAPRPELPIFIAALTAVGDQQTVRAGVDRYLAAGVTLPCVGPISRTAFEATLRAAAPS